MALTSKSAGELTGRVKYDGTMYKVHLTRDIGINGKPYKAGSIVEVGGSDLKYILGMKMGEVIEMDPKDSGKKDKKKDKE